jgi:hypothetical protein
VPPSVTRETTSTTTGASPPPTQFTTTTKKTEIGIPGFTVKKEKTTTSNSEDSDE